MRELGAAKKNDFCLSFLGRKLAVLIEEKSREKNGSHQGFSRNYLTVRVPATEGLVNREVVVKTERFVAGCLIGKPVDTNAAENILLGA